MLLCMPVVLVRYISKSAFDIYVTGIISYKFSLNISYPFQYLLYHMFVESTFIFFQYLFPRLNKKVMVLMLYYMVL